jgi:hypothetical protein
MTDSKLVNIADKWIEYKVTLQHLTDYKQKLLHVDENLFQDFSKIWKGDQRMIDHMTRRFREIGMNDVGVFLKTLHPGTSRELACKYKIYDNHIFEFFGYVKCGIAPGDIKEWGLNVDDFHLKSSIQFFFSLNNELQNKIIDDYNKTYDELE